MIVRPVSKNMFLLIVAVLSCVIFYSAYTFKRSNLSEPFNMDLLTIVNYTGLPEGEDVRIYPANHTFSGKKLWIVIENNRNESLYFGSEWKAEKWDNGRWVYKKPPWDAWTSILLVAEPNNTTTFNVNAFFDPGIYRITKDFMLTENYLRDEQRWESKFTVQFIVYKTS